MDLFCDSRLNPLSQHIRDEWEDPQLIMDVLEQLNLTEKRFIVCYEEDWADIPLGGGWIACENGFMVPETYWDIHESDTYEGVFTCFNIPQKNVNWSSYRDARNDYYAARQHTED